MNREQLNYFMNIALEEAKKAYLSNEVPIGSIVVLDNTIIGYGHNLVEKTNDSSMHAEIIALKQAARNTGNWRLNNAFLFSTIEPCIMCTFACILFRIDTIVFGAYDKKFGGCNSLVNIPSLKNINHRINVIPEILQEESYELMKKFFKDKR